MVKIVQKDDPVLRKIAKSIEVVDINTSKIKRIIEDMKTVLNSCDDGIALAAPQIGQSIRLFIVSPKAFEIMSKIEPKQDIKGGNYLVCFNPKITKTSSKKMLLEEGCLSVRWLYGKIKRSQKVTISAINEDGQKFERGASGLLAEIFQHEIDHLDGKLFIDEAFDLITIKPEEKHE